MQRWNLINWLVVVMFAGVVPVLAEDDAGAGKPEGKKEELPAKEGSPVVKEEKKLNKRVFGKSDEESFEGKVVVIKVGEDDLINTHAFKFWRRVIRRVNDEGARAVVFDINTPGGYAFETARLIMEDMQKLEVPSYAFVNQKALSAGALVASGTDKIYMHPISAIGAAAVVRGDGREMDETMRAKVESALSAFVRAVSESKGHNPDVLRAMMIVDETHKFGKVKAKKGELLTLTGKEAIGKYKGKPLLAVGLVESVDELLEQEGLSGYEVIVAEPTGMEKFAFWVASFSALLILVGIGGAYLEMKTPGFGIGGAVSLLAFGVFFFGNYAAGNMAGYGLMLLFILGIVLVAVELFVLPGMIVPGVLGACLVLGSLFMAMIDEFAFEDNAVRGWDAAGAWDFIVRPAVNLSIGVLGSVVLLMLMMRFLPDMPLFNKLVMGGELATGASMGSGDEQKETRVGHTGTAVTDLRPAGKGEIEGQVMDVTAASGFIEEGEPIVVTEEDGMRVLVEEVRSKM